MYIENNPVRQQYVELAQQWAHPNNEWLLDRDWYANAK